MDNMSYSALRSQLADVLDRVTDNHEAVTITRQNAPSAVLMSLEDYDALMETLHLLRSPRNAARLAEAIADVKAGKRLRARKLSAT